MALTDREIEIARLRARGARPKEIAGTLDVSVKTIAMSLYRISRKLGVKTRGQFNRAVDDLESRREFIMAAEKVGQFLSGHAGTH